MIRPEFRKTLESQQTVLVSLWAAFTIAIFLYLWIAELILASPKFPARVSFSETARMILWLLAILDLGYLIWWKKRFLTKHAILEGSKKFKLLQALQEHKSPLEEQAAGVISSYITGKIVAFAIVEAIAVYGLILALVGRYVWDQYLFSIASGALLLFEFPSKHFLEELLRDVEVRGS
ncbi:MAG: hypothetical protein ACREQA_02010 [Candidatus Binatia bacterium]